MRRHVSGDHGREKKQLPPRLNSPTNLWEKHRDCKIPERRTGRCMDILQFTQQSGESGMRRGRTRCGPAGTHPGQTA
ncbi:Uncharacterised protein [Chlamydia abortus]|nr:Uncharacterised protein [Chlamydia abortus]SGA02351.1 Uncharacterised protein [Chlamydia abortus]SGA33831.1 Uncharacterised protein [Chlamydia abortus]